MPIRTMLCVVVLLLVLSAGCGGREAAEPADGWLAFEEGMKKAVAEKKPVVIDFYTSWCRWCKVMDEKTFSDPEVARYLGDHFVAIRINAESRTEEYEYEGRRYTPVELTRHFRVTGFPSLAFLDAEGELVTIIPGFIPAETFLPLLRYMRKECYKQRMTFEEFMKRMEECEEKQDI